MTRTLATILVVDDEPPIRRLLKTSLGAQGYDVIEAGTGTAALAAVERDKPDLMILDLGLPDLDGAEVIRRLRPQSPLPIIVLSSRDDERGKVEALDLGANDYVVKPFGMEELVARIRAALRTRLAGQGLTAVVKTGDLAVDLTRRRVTLAGLEVHLSPKEWGILKTLAAHAGKVLTHRFLLKEVWGSEDGADVQYLRVYMRQLRQKLETDPERPRHLLTETGVGYRLAVPDLQENEHSYQ